MLNMQKFKRKLFQIVEYQKLVHDTRFIINERINKIYDPYRSQLITNKCNRILKESVHNIRYDKFQPIRARNQLLQVINHGTHI